MVQETDSLVMSIPEAGKLLGISRIQSYKMAKAGLFPLICVGKRKKMVPKPAFMRMLENVGANV